MSVINPICEWASEIHTTKPSHTTTQWRQQILGEAGICEGFWTYVYVSVMMFVDQWQLSINVVKLWCGISFAVASNFMNSVFIKQPQVVTSFSFWVVEAKWLMGSARFAFFHHKLLLASVCPKWIAHQPASVLVALMPSHVPGLSTMSIIVVQHHHGT